MYAWSTMAAPPDDKGKVKTFKPGDEVSAGDLGLDDDEFNELVSVGAVREAEYPVPADYDGSPVEYARDQLRAAADAQFMGVLPFGSVAPISERPPGSSPVVPLFDERAKEAMELTGFDPDKPPEEGKEPKLSEQDQAAADAAKSASAPKNSGAPAPAATTTPPTTTPS